MPPPDFLRCADETPAALTIQGASEGFELHAAEAGDGDKPKARRFSMTAYTGVPMRPPGFYGSAVVVDLAGVKVPRQDIPILRQHDPERIVGHTTAVEVTSQRIRASGLISGTGDAANEVLATASNGFPWQASVGLSIERMEYVERGETEKVNGRNFDGPGYIVRAGTLGELSFVPMGADGATSATIAAQNRGNPMTFEQWLAAKGIDPAQLSEPVKIQLRAGYDSEHGAKPKPTPEADPLADVRAKRAAEAERCDGIERVCAKHDNPQVEIEENGKARRVSLKAHAISCGWDVERTEARAELESLRASRAKVDQPGTGGSGPTFVFRNGPNGGPAVPQGVTASAAVEAAICLSIGSPNVEKRFRAEVLQAADDHFRGIGLQQVMMMAAAQNGYSCRPAERITQGNLREVLRYAFSPPAVAASGFSTVSLPGILGNVANKEILAGYMEEDQTWREVSATKPVNDFKQVTSYRLLDNMEYEELGPGGKIKHGTVSEESYTRQAKTFAKMYALERTQIINDDLGAFADLRSRLGRGSAKKFNNVFWSKFLYDHATFFTAARTNYISGSTTNLGTDGVGLGLAVKAFRMMTSPTADGAKRVGGRPDRLIVPPELEGAAEVLYKNQNLGSVKSSDANIYANLYRPVVVPWLSDSAFTGYSTTAWYLFRSPADLPMMVASFLNGMQTPTVESADADFDQLGVQFRGYHDFGCDQAEYLAGIKSKGAA